MNIKIPTDAWSGIPKPSDYYAKPPNNWNSAQVDRNILAIEIDRDEDITIIDKAEPVLTASLRPVTLTESLTCKRGYCILIDRKPEKHVHTCVCIYAYDLAR